MGGSESNVESMYIKEQVFTDTISGAIKTRSTRRRTSSRGRTSTPTKTKTKSNTKSNTKSKAVSIKKKKKTVQTPKSSPSKKWINHLPKIGRMVDWKFGKDWWTGVVTNIDADFVTVNYIVDDGDLYRR